MRKHKSPSCNGSTSIRNAGFPSYVNSTKHIRQLRSMYGRGERWHAGAIIHRELLSLMLEKETSNGVKGLAALKRGGTVRSMWVCKDSVAGHRRGDKVLNRALKEHLEGQGMRFREVSYPADRRVKASLARMAKALAPFHHQSQYGFVPKRDCVLSASRHKFAKTVYLLDIENAFDQISEWELHDILTKGFLLNSRDAWAVCTISCKDGHLYQGSPIAPAVFNIRALWMVERLERLCQATGCMLSVYADDLTISSETWDHFSSGFRKTVLRIIRECGLKVNEAKCKVRRIDPRRIGSCDITGLAVDYDPDTGVPFVRPLHKRQVIRKANYIQYLRVHRGIEFSNELARDGTLKDLAAVEDGLRGWAKRKGQEPTTVQLALNVAAG